MERTNGKNHRDHGSNSRAPTLRDETPVLLDERVNSAHLCDDHAAGQLIERVAWAVADAEEAEHAL
jgi:hypothetical protein